MRTIIIAIMLFFLCSCEIIYDRYLKPHPSRDDLVLKGKYRNNLLESDTLSLAGFYYGNSNLYGYNIGFYKLYSDGNALAGFADLEKGVF